MKLDPKINSIRDVLTPFDDGTGEVGEYCAFANELETFKNLDECTFGTLKRFGGDENFPFEFEATVSLRAGTAKFCLPYYKLKESWRPFESLGEFLQKFPLGSEIRCKDDEYVKTELFTALFYLPEMSFGVGYEDPDGNLTDSDSEENVKVFYINC